MLHRHFSWLLMMLCFLAAAGWLSAAVIEQARPKTPAASELVARCAGAMGGGEAIRNLKTLRLHPVYPDHGDEPIPMEILRPNRSRTPRNRFIFDGQRACLLGGIDGKSAPREFSSDDLKDCEVEIGWFFPAFFDHPGEYAGSETVDGREFHKLKVALPLGAILFYWLDVQTGLVARAATTLVFAGKEYKLERTFGDYRTVDGYTFPYAFTYQGRQGVQNGRMEKIEFNPVLDEADFRIPTETKK